MSKHSYFRHLATTLFQADQAVQFYYMSMIWTYTDLNIFTAARRIHENLSFLSTAARRIQENMLHKRHSLSESFMNLIDGNKDLLNHLNNCRKDAQSSISNK